MTETVSVKRRKQGALPPLRIDWSLTGLFVALALLSMTVPTLILGKDVFSYMMKLAFDNNDTPFYGSLVHFFFNAMVLLMSLIMIIMMIILLSRQFSHLYKRDIADTMNALPYNRMQNLTGGLLSCIIQLSIPLFVNAVVMLTILSQWLPDAVKESIPIFLRQWVGLLMLTAFSLLLLTLCGKFGDAIGSMILLNMTVTFIYFAAGNVWSGGNIGERIVESEIWLLFMPVIDYLRPYRKTLSFLPYKHLAWFVVLLVILYVVYIRRPSEYAETRVGNYGYYRIIQVLSGITGIVFFVVFMRGIFGFNHYAYFESSDIIAYPLGGLLGIWISGLIGGKYKEARSMKTILQNETSDDIIVSVTRKRQNRKDIILIWVISVVLCFLLIWHFASLSDPRM